MVSMRNPPKFGLPQFEVLLRLWLNLRLFLCNDFNRQVRTLLIEILKLVWFGQQLLLEFFPFSLKLSKLSLICALDLVGAHLVAVPQKSAVIRKLALGESARGGHKR